MAYAVHANRSSHCNPEEQTVGKMERLHDSFHEATHDRVTSGDNEIAAPTETIDQSLPAPSHDPAGTPLHMPQLDQHGDGAGSTGAGTAVGTPSTVSTAPSTEDDASFEALNKVGLDKLLLFEDTATPGPGRLPRPRDRGVPPLNPNIPASGDPTTRTESNLTPVMSNADRQNNSHRRVRSWGDVASYHFAGGAVTPQRPGTAFSEAVVHPSGIPPYLTLSGVHPFTDANHGPFATSFPSRSPTTSPPYSLPTTPPRAHTEHPWAPTQSRVASFRTDPSMMKNNVSSQQQPQQHRHPYPQIPDHWNRESSNRQKFLVNPNPTSSGYNTPTYPSFKTNNPNTGYQHSPPMATTTPPRLRNPRQSVAAGQNPHRGPPGAATPPRSSAEILKTLLRKKACLYEPETSRAVALVTWMVGRELALKYGYFSRQQLQSGVHACVAGKIESGAITRTKVNRCMQIILNSCFHYIIPLPDGTEDSGSVFREAFAHQAKDDSYLVRTLGAPWDGLVAERETILDAAAGVEESTPSPESSPRLESVRRDRRGAAASDGQVGGDTASKRTVLLCFNENVRSVEDVFRCHTEFIRDTANTSKLQLSAQEWRSFFGKHHTVPALGADGSTSVPSSLLGVPQALTQPFDSLGQMSPGELAQFRTSWCAKRYEHDHDLCGFAHVGVGGGWLRRNPSLHAYGDEMCPSVSTVLDDRWGPRCFVINSCSKGEDCPLAHSKEEVDYHPNQYKSHTCSTLYSRSGTPVMGRCTLGDLCPHLHPTEAVSPPSSAATSPVRKPAPAPVPQQQQQHRRPGRGEGFRSGGPGAAATLPNGAPMLYVDPAPVSKFENRLGLPGLQSLFRRHCHVIHAHLRDGPDSKCRCYYSNFGDDWGKSFKTL